MVQHLEVVSPVTEYIHSDLVSELAAETAHLSSVTPTEVSRQRCDDALISSISLLRALGRDDKVVHVAIAELEFVRSFLPTVTPAEVAKLTERLRNHIECQEGAGGVWWETPDVCEEAATALEALVAELAAVKASRDGYAKDAAARADECDRLRADLAKARKALEPFSAMADEMFVRGWNENNVVIALDNPDEPHRVTAGDFFVARRALTGGKEDG